MVQEIVSSSERKWRAEGHVQFMSTQSTKAQSTRVRKRDNNSVVSEVVFFCHCFITLCTLCRKYATKVRVKGEQLGTIEKWLLM